MSTSRAVPTATFSAVLGWVIRELRKQKGLAQSDLARALNLQQPSWSRIETGTSTLNVQQLVIVARCLSTTSQDILNIADRARNGLVARGVDVTEDRSTAKSEDLLAVIGLLGIGALIGAHVFGGKK